MSAAGGEPGEELARPVRYAITAHKVAVEISLASLLPGILESRRLVAAALQAGKKLLGAATAEAPPKPSIWWPSWSGASTRSAGPCRPSRSPPIPLS